MGKERKAGQAKFLPLFPFLFLAAKNRNGSRSYEGRNLACVASAGKPPVGAGMGQLEIFTKCESNPINLPSKLLPGTSRCQHCQVTTSNLLVARLP